MIKQVHLIKESTQFMQLFVEDDTDGEALVTFNFVQLHSFLFSYIHFSLVPFSSV